MNGAGCEAMSWAIFGSAAMIASAISSRLAVLLTKMKARAFARIRIAFSSALYRQRSSFPMRIHCRSIATGSHTRSGTPLPNSSRRTFTSYPASRIAAMSVFPEIDSSSK